MRSVVFWIAAWGAWWVAVAASAEPPTVEWCAPAACPDERAIERMLRRSVDADSQPVVRHARAQITQVFGGYEMQLVLRTDAATHEKRFVAELCSTLVELLSLELGFSSWNREAPVPREAASAPLRWGLHLSGDVRTSPTPLPSGALSLGLLASRARLRAELRAAYGGPREVRYRMPRSVGGRFELFAAEARACYAIPAGMVSIPLCAGAELGALRARGVGVSPASTATRLTAGALAATALEVPVAGPVAVWVELVGVVQLVVPRYGVRNLPPLYQPKRLGIRGALGIVYTFE